MKKMIILILLLIITYTAYSGYDVFFPGIETFSGGFRYVAYKGDCGVCGYNEPPCLPEGETCCNNTRVLFTYYYSGGQWSCNGPYKVWCLGCCWHGCVAQFWDGDLETVLSWPGAESVDISKIYEAFTLKEFHESGFLEYLLNYHCPDGVVDDLDTLINLEIWSPTETECHVSFINDPVYASNGEYGLTSTDLVIPGRGIPVVIERFFGNQREYNGRFGFGWNLNYNMKVRPLYTEDDPNTVGIDESEDVWDVVLIDEKGFSREYSRENLQTTKLIRPEDRSNYIEYDDQGTYPYTFVKTSGLKYRFNGLGNLVLIEDRHGNNIQLQYASEGLSDVTGNSGFFPSPSEGGPDQGRGVVSREYKLEKIIDTLGREILFYYNNDGLLSEIRVSDNDTGYRNWLYSYDGYYNVLTKVESPEVEDPANPPQTYRPARYYKYDDPACPRAITAVYDAENDPDQSSPTPVPFVVNTYGYDSNVEDQTYGQTESSETYADSTFLNYYDRDNNRVIVHSREKVQQYEGKRIDISVYTDSGQTLSETVASNENDPNLPTRAFTTTYEYDSRNEIVKAISPKRSCVEYDRTYLAGSNDFNLEELTVIQRPECDVLPFNGTSDYVTISDANDLYGFDPNTSDFSVAFWVKRLQAEQEEILLDKRDASGDGWCVKFDSSNNVVCSLDAINITGTTDVNDSDWHYIVVSIDRDGDGAIFVDGGSAEGTTAINSELMDTTAILTVGCCSYASTGYFEGSLDELMIVNRALSRDKADLYNIFGLSEYSAGLIGYWKMDDDAATTTVLDSSDSGNDGVAGRNTVLMVDDGFVPGEVAILTTFKQHNGLDYVDTVTDPNGNETVFTYDFDDPNLYGSDVGNLMKVTYPAVSTPQGMQTPEVTYTYNAYGQVLTTTSVDGIVTKFDYYTDPYDTENYGRLWKTTVDYGTDPNCLNVVSTVEYDKYGRADKVTDAQNNATQFTYNDLDLLIKTTLPAPFSYETQFAYNKNKKLAQTKRAIGGTYQYTDYTYNLLDNLKSVMDPLEHVTSMGYDDNENITSVTDAEDNATTSKYDERDLLWKVTDAEGGVTEYSYDANGNLKTIKDAEGNVTSYTYDVFDRLTRTTYPDDTYEAYSYNIRSQVTSATNRGGDTVTNIYDNVGRLVTVVGPSNDPNITYTYDIVGRVVSVDHNGDITDFAYDRLGRVIQVEDPESRLVDYTYDTLSRRTSLVYPDNSYITYEYDELSRLTKIIDDSNSIIAEYSYDELSRRTGVTLENDANTVYAYDLANRLTDLDNHLPDPNNGSITFDYTYDNVGNRLSMTVDTSDLHSYLYDDIYQLTDVNYPSGFGTDIAYAYDSVHNRTSTDNGSVVSYTANNLNQYTAVGGTNLYYDNNGNLTDDGTYDYIYDIFNRLIEVQYNSATVAEYGYDYSGRRISKTVYGGSTVTTKYAYDGDQVIAEYDPGAPGLLRKFIYGPGIDEPVCMIDVDGQTETRYYYHYDGLGSVIALSNTDGDIVEAYSYDVFGTPTIYTAAGADGLWRTADDTTATVSAVGNPYLFTGRRYDDETGLYYYRARMYAPDLGRFMQTDPIGYAEGINWYAYCGNNPTVYIDPMGLATFPNRPLEGSSWWVPVVTAPLFPIMDSLNIEVSHEQIIYEDSIGGDIGFFNDGASGKVQSDKPENITQYFMSNLHYDDALVRQAVENVKHRNEVKPYQLTWIGKQDKYNCQDFGSSVKNEYKRLGGKVTFVPPLVSHIWRANQNIQLRPLNPNDEMLNKGGKKK